MLNEKIASLNPYFIGLSILILSNTEDWDDEFQCLNPYFIGLSILMRCFLDGSITHSNVSILILLDYLFLFLSHLSQKMQLIVGLNPYFIGLSILIDVIFNILARGSQGLNPYFIGLSILIFQRSRFSNYEYYYVSILILLDYLFLWLLLILYWIT